MFVWGIGWVCYCFVAGCLVFVVYCLLLDLMNAWCVVILCLGFWFVLRWVWLGYAVFGDVIWCCLFRWVWLVGLHV